MKARLRLELGEQLVGLAHDMHDAGELASAHGLERERIVLENPLDFDAEAIENDASRVVGGTADGVEADLLADQVLEGLDLGPHIDVHVGRGTSG